MKKFELVSTVVVILGKKLWYEINYFLCNGKIGKKDFCCYFCDEVLLLNLKEIAFNLEDEPSRKLPFHRELVVWSFRF